jgi:predicted short-subunit dehydrogenase-like oxidoreductase (DUF2520 family)
MTWYNVSFAGAGRVAGALCREMYRSGHNIRQIVSESATEGKPLAEECKALWSQEPVFLDPSDIIIVAVPDSKLIRVLSEIRCPKYSIIAHTAGSYGLEVFPDRLKKTGVFYPLQTFSKERVINFMDLPFLIEASDKKTGEILEKLAESVNGKVHFIDTERRKKIHLAAVFVCNFTNHMLTAGKRITAEAGLSFKLLEPLIRETISKALEYGPDVSQTGPAVRNDLNTIEKHLELLSFSPDLRKLYKEVTQSIRKHNKLDR